MITVNQRPYRVLARPTVVVCVDGCEPDYIAQAVAHGRMPGLKQVLAEGPALVADCVIPSFTNPNNLSIVTGVPPSVHGICGNTLFDVASGTEVMLNDPKWLRAPTLLAALGALADAGRTVAVSTANDKLRKLLGHGMKGFCFSAEKAGEATCPENGISGVVDLVGMVVPPVYSAELSEFVFAAGVRLMSRPVGQHGRPDVLYLSTPDYVQHKHAPGTEGADAFDAFDAMMNHCLGPLDAMGCVIALTADPEQVLAMAHAYKPRLTRFERASILNRCAALVRERSVDVAALISAASGLCLKDAIDEAGRITDVLVFGANECLKDDGQIFSCDLTPHGKRRRACTQRDPLLGVITAITPFNHPVNPVAHKVVPSIATNNRMVLKPSEKVPLSALLFANLLDEAGLPPEMLSVITVDPREIADERITKPHVDLVTFTGGVAIGKFIASKAGYKRMVFELGANGANDPIIVMDDADLDAAATLAVHGSYKNSGQRCTAVKRLLVHEAVAARFTELVVEKTRAWRFGDPSDATLDMGALIDEQAAQLFEAGVNEAGAQGARRLVGNGRDGALYSPTVLDRVRPEMSVAMPETFGPVSPIISFANIDEAIRISNGTACGLASAVCTNRLDPVTRCVAELQLGTVNVREVAGYRLAVDALRRHQGFRPGRPGRRAGSDQELHQRQDLLSALGMNVAASARARRPAAPSRAQPPRGPGGGTPQPGG